jgi:hypothetical protein
MRVRAYSAGGREANRTRSSVMLILDFLRVLYLFYFNAGHTHTVRPSRAVCFDFCCFVLQRPHAVPQWLRHNATIWKVAASIPHEMKDFCQ